MANVKRSGTSVKASGFHSSNLKNKVQNKVVNKSRKDVPSMFFKYFMF
jgi:hypothetical protein